MFKLLFITFISTFVVTVAAAGNMTLLEEAAEFETLSTRVSGNGDGQLRLRPCDECDEVRLKITATTSLEVAGKLVPLSTLNKYTLHSGTVFYRISDRVVTRIEAVR